MLCLAAKNEERRLAKLRRRKQYHKSQPPQRKNDDTPSKRQEAGPKQSASASKVTCYSCGRNGHYARDCRRSKSESAGRAPARNKTANTKQVKSDSAPVSQELVDILYSSTDEEADICSVRVTDKGSQPRCAEVERRNNHRPRHRHKCLPSAYVLCRRYRCHLNRMH